MAKRGKAAAAESAAYGWRSRIVDRGTADPRDLLPHPMNHRQHPVSQRDHLRAAIREVGFVRSVTVNRTTGHVLDGHLRLDLALEDKEPLIDVEWVELSEAEERLVLASMDQITAGAEIDPVKLDALLQEVQASEPDLQRLLAGMATDAGLYLTDDPPEIEEDEAPEPPAEPITRPGDLWILGEHRLLCGDSTKAEDVGRLLEGHTPFIMVTDPPYGVEYEASWRNEAKRPDGTPYGAARTGVVTNDERVDWTDAYKLFPGHVAYVWHAGRHAAELVVNLRSAGFSIRSQVIWRKPRFIISRGHYHWQHEPCWYSVRKGGTSKWCGDRSQSTIWDIALKDSTGETNHSTQKPVECMARPIRNHGGPGDDVYEPFSGSGTTIIAAEQLDRRCYAMEISPQYCDVAVTRWENLTGQVAERVPASEPVTEHANG